MEIAIEAADRIQINETLEIFERNVEAARIPAPKVSVNRPTVFIGHGGARDWRDLKDHLQDKHRFSVEAYETGSRAGHVIRDILEAMIVKSSFAILVFTGEDEQVGGSMRARQNVVHETGIFQGRLGFSRAIVLLEKDVERFSNLDGIQYLEFTRGNIRETFGDVLAALDREFPR
jgi:predicted nucleotide-binding protein